MGLSSDQKQAIAEFTEDFENACVGLQLKHPEVPTLTPNQYGIALVSGIYAVMALTERSKSGHLTDMPGVEDGADFVAFINAASVHYADLLTDTAVREAESLLDALSLPPEITAMLARGENP